MDRSLHRGVRRLRVDCLPDEAPGQGELAQAGGAVHQPAHVRGLHLCRSMDDKLLLSPSG